MAEHSAAHADDHGHGDHGDGHHGAHHDVSFYLKTYAVLMVLFIISVVGPMAEILWLTLITAFGVAFVKAGLVIRNFMHLNVERPIIWYSLITALVFMVLFFFGTASDVMNHEGQNWQNVAAEAEVARGLAAGDGHGHHGEGDHHDDGHGDEGHGDKGHGDKGHEDGHGEGGH